MKTKNIDLAILIPAFGESKRIEPMLKELASYLKQHNFGKTAVTIVSAHKPHDSHNQTVVVARAHAKLFNNFSIIDVGPHAPGLKGHDVKLGMLKIDGKYKMFMDADMATPLHHLEPMYKALKSGADIVIGERDLAKIHKGIARRFISMGGNLLVRVLLRIHYTDTQCGFKAFRAEVARDLFSLQTINGWGFDMEILAIAHRRRYRVTKLKIDDWKDIAGGNLEGKAAQAALSSLKDILYIRWNLWRGRYKRA